MRLMKYGHLECSFECKKKVVQIRHVGVVCFAFVIQIREGWCMVKIFSQYITFLHLLFIELLMNEKKLLAALKDVH